MSNVKFLRTVNSSLKFVRLYSEESCTDPNSRKGLVLGVFETLSGQYKLSDSAAKYDAMTGGKLASLISSSSIKLGTARIFHNMPGDFYAIAVVGLGVDNAKEYDEDEVLNEVKENIRTAAGVGAQALQHHKIKEIHIESFGNPEPAAEGSFLGIWHFQELKHPFKRCTASKLHLYDEINKNAWFRGMVKSEGQNTARRLEETPANLMTPSMFAEATLKALCPHGVDVVIRDRDWLEMKGFTSFLSMCRGSCEPPLFIEITYCGAGPDDNPVVFAGKGVTFDSGGICLRRCKGMSEYRADLAGGAVVVGAVKASAQLKIPMNIKAFIPLCENMPGGSANKPGDLFFSMNRKSIRMVDTSKEGRIALADTLTYTKEFKPCLIISVATLTEGIRVALGGCASGVFCNSSLVWQEVEKAGAETGDRVWRMPFWKYFCSTITSNKAFDVKNVGDGRGGTPCIGAMFLRQFMPPVDFLHFDITGTGMLSSGVGYPYLKEGLMTGRPVRTITEFLDQMAIITSS